jgi:SAM-dependent methyltransferase
MDRFRNTRQPDWDWWGRLWTAPGETLRDLGLGPGNEVAEVCAGNGYFALPAARIAEPADVYAVDIDEGLLEELEDIAEMNGVTNIETVAADACELSEHTDDVEFVLLANTLHGVDDTRRILSECREVLADDGRLVVVNWHDLPEDETTVAGERRGPPRELRMTPDETVEAVGSAGFTEKDRVELPPYHYAVVF